MFFDEKKKSMGAAILGLQPAEDSDQGGYGPSDHREVLKGIAQELIDSVHAKDVDGVIDALDAYWQCIEEGDEEQDQALD